MIQVQPQFIEKNQWFDLAKEQNLRFEILEFSSVYYNAPVPNEIIDWYYHTERADSIHGVFIDNYPMSLNREIREASRKKCEESCVRAISAGAHNVIFHSTALPFVRKGNEVSWAKEAAEYYQALARRYDLDILVENFNDVDPTPLCCMMDYVTDDRVRVCLDIGHANYTRTPLEEWFERLDDKIGYLHISDNLGLWDDHLPLGDGTVNFQAAHKWWEKNGKDIPITIEVSEIKDTKRSLQFLKTHEYFGMV